MQRGDNLTIRSFDVFDTCLTRKAAVPSSIFYEVAQKVFARLGISSNRPLIEDFVAARIQAEQSARRQSDREDVSLVEIWHQLTRVMGWQHDDSLANCELEVEAELLTPICNIRAQVRLARQRGCRIIFVSDMYLPTEFIERQLVKHGFARPGDGIYVSGEIGKTKASGNLFRHLLAQENVSAANVWHTGDNELGDYAVPRKLGIQAEIFSQGKLTRAEMSVLQTGQDAQAAARIVGAMRAFRLGCHSEAGGDVNELASQFVAPIVMGFATWVLQRAQKDGVKRLYFLSRDCQLIWKAAKVLAPQFGEIDCRYLLVSRQSLRLPTADTISPEGMPWMRRPFENQMLKSMLAKIELKFEDIELGLAALSAEEQDQLCLESEQDWQRIWSGLNQEPVKTRIQNLIVKRRKTALKYLESAGLLEAVPWALVDFGWALSCQESVQQLLKLSGWPHEAHGYYFGLMKHRLTGKEVGSSEALFYQQALDFPSNGVSSCIFNHHILFDGIVGCADHPTVHHYEEIEAGKAGPAFMSAASEKTIAFSAKLQGEVLSFIRENQTLVEDFKDKAINREFLALLVESFFKNPGRQLVMAIREMAASGDQNGLGAVPIVKPLNLGTALLPLLPRCRSFKAIWKRRDCLWPEGSRSITPLQVQRVSDFVQRMVNIRRRIVRKLIK